ncbi:MAG: DUF3084 domain-containing protein [Armatimonadetes bacterium]|nr:DUF3084 domain-containing protein [Armatimonadota bacterium]
MDAYTLFLFLGLTLAGGSIAFMGDRLGRYMGKRRMTIFGLRPRHTALLFTVITGIFIAITSLVTMSLVSTDVRRAVFQVGALVRDRDRLEQDSEELRGERDRLQRARSEAKAAADRARADEVRARADLVKTQERLRQAQQAAARRTALLEREAEEQSRAAARKSAEINRLSNLLSTRRREFQRVSGQLADAEKRRAEAEARYREAAARYDQVSERYRAAEDELRETDGLLQTAREQLSQAEAQRDDLRRHAADLTRQVRDADDQIQALAREKEGLEQSRTALLASRDVLQSDLEELRTEKERLISEHEALRGSEVIFELGEEIAWEVIDGREPRTRVRERLGELVEKARRVALARGAGPNKDRPELALAVVRETSRPDQPTAPVLLVADAALDLAASEISRANTGVVTQIVAYRNAVAGETVSGYINTWTNRLAFREGETIAQAGLPARQSTALILEQLVVLLQQNVRVTAVHRGMIPRPVAPGIEGALHVGQVPLTDLLATAEKAHRASHGATIEVLAATDLWTADSMKVSFRVTLWPAPPDLRPSGSILGIR